jgi:TolB-like protein
MNKKCLVFFIALLIVNVVCNAQQLTVAVSRFEARAGQSKDDAEGITELFIAELVANGGVRVVDRNSFDKMLAEMKFQDTDWADSNKVAQLGKALNANSIIRGKLMTLADQIVISASILDINTAQILSSSTIQMTNIEEVFIKMNGLVKNMTNNLQRPSQTNSSQVLTMAVSPFDIRSGLSTDELEVVMELFIAELVSNSTTKVVDRNSFDKIRVEMNFQDSDWADSNKVAQLGRALNANSVIRGTVMTLGGQTSVTSTILDINTAQILSSATMRFANKAEIFTAVYNFEWDMWLNLPANLRTTRTFVQIGGKGQAGGILFYDKGSYSNGWRFLEAAPPDTEFLATWNNANSGCRSLNVNGFTDWRLPNSNELDLMYKNLYQKGLGGFRNYPPYRSSTQGDGSTLSQDFRNGRQEYGTGTGSWPVRAVRAF